MSPSPPLLVMRDIDKRFQGAQALTAATLEVAPAEVMALVGQNGAGKSTLIKVLTGAHRKDAGSIVFGGQEIEFASPQEAQRGGISTIYQEINLIPYRSVAENIFLGRQFRRYGLLDWRRMNREAADLLRRQCRLRLDRGGLSFYASGRGPLRPGLRVFYQRSP